MNPNDKDEKYVEAPRKAGQVGRSKGFKPATAWLPGATPYQDFLAKLTPIEREAHREKHRMKKSIRKAKEAVIAQYMNEFIAALHLAEVSLLRKAITDGDSAAYAAVSDRIIGKPQTQLDVTSKGKQMPAPTIIFDSQTPDEWDE